MSILLEVCVDSYAFAMSAIKGSVDRLDLGSSLCAFANDVRPKFAKKIMWL